MKRNIFSLIRLVILSGMIVAGSVECKAQAFANYVDNNYGNNYINTGYIPNNNTKVTIVLDFVDEYDRDGDEYGRAIFGCGTGDNAGEFWLAQDRDDDHYNGTTQLRFKVGSVTTEKTWGFDSRHSKGDGASHYRITLSNGACKMETTTDNGATWNAFKSCSFTPNAVFESTFPMYIGTINPCGGGAWDASDIWIREVFISENGVMKRHYLPAQNGFYETISNTIVTSVGMTSNIYKDVCQHKFTNISSNGQQMTCNICGTTTNTNVWAKAHDRDCDITTIDPYLNADNATFEGDVQQMLILSGTNNISDVCVIDSASNGIVTLDQSESSETRKITLPNTDKPLPTYICAQARIPETVNSLTDSITVFSSIPLTMQPMHYPHGFSATQQPGIQADGTRQPYNELTWYIDSPETAGQANDLYSNDMFLITRSYTKDFSEETILHGNSYGLTEYTLKDGKGYYTFKDDTDQGQYNTNKTVYRGENSTEVKSLLAESSLTSVEKLSLSEFYKGQQPVYYRLQRAVTNTLFGSDAKKFIATDTVSLHNMLPPVSGISVEKTDNWSSSKRVTLTVSLRNPYPWQFNSVMDSAKIHSLMANYPNLSYRRYTWDENTNITITRSCPAKEYYEGKDMAAETLTINGSDVKWNATTGCYEAEITDVQSLPFTHYYYTAELDTTNSLYPTSGAVIPVTTTEDEANDCYTSSVASISDLTASQGDANGGVNLSWNLNIDTSDFGTSTLRLTRRQYKGADDNGQLQYGESEVVNLDNTLTSYTDSKALVGNVYEYSLESTFSFRGAEYTTTSKVLGWTSYKGYISGKVLMPNGTAVAGATVYVRSTDPIDIADVKDEFGNIIMEGVHTGLTTDAKAIVPTGLASGSITADTTSTVEKYKYTYIKELTTDELGNFTDTVYFQSTGTLYEVNVVYGTSSFTYNGNAVASINLSQDKWKYTDVNMVSGTAYAFNGNVLYENSTIPVMGAKFELIHYGTDGKVSRREYLHDKDGELITTDQRGKFSISLLPVSASLRVVKEGHTMKDGGYIKIDEDTIFTPKKQQDGLKLWDQTKVRMIGRIVGGNVQGNLPLGQGLSKNNLGDSLTVVLQLEGDNTSKIVYYEDDPDNSTIQKTVEHGICDSKGKDLGYKTDVTFERKRIIIKPDATTGEFFVDLAPAKYKVTQLSACGYSTLYQSGEGFDVLDYTDSTSTTVYYNRVYHKNASITYTQSLYGHQTQYIGEPSITIYDLSGNSSKIQIACDTTNTANGEKAACYAFKHPVFSTSSNYQLQVAVHEDFYYNNDEQSGTLDMVNLNGGTLHVRNNMLADNRDVTYTLDSNGSATIFLSADDPDFTHTGDEALRTVNMQAEYKDYFYDTHPIQTYVLGEKDNGTDIVPLGDAIQLADIIRDPYGAKSYAWREAGTTYHWAFDYTTKNNSCFNLDFTEGYGADYNFGLAVSYRTSYSFTINTSLKISNIDSDCNRRVRGYDLTTTEKICTSADQYDEGAMADVYVGLVNEVGIGEGSCITVISKEKYDAVKDHVKLIASGINNAGDTCCLVNGKIYQAETSIGKSTFAYSQKYILGTLIPDLQSKRDALLLNMTDTAAIHAIAKNLGEPQYYKDADGVVHMITPDDSKTWTNQFFRYNNMIEQWETVIGENEMAKLSAYVREGDATNLIKSYSVAGTTIDYSQKASGYSQKASWSEPIEYTWSLGGGGGKNGLAGNTNSKAYEDAKNDKSGEKQNDLTALGLILKLSMSGGQNVTKTSTRTYYKMSSAGFGFHLDTYNNGYFTMGVYRDISNKTTTTSISNDAASEVVSSDNEDVKYDNDGDYVDGEDTETQLSNFVYWLEGGATRDPWFAGDTTIVYRTGTSLGSSTKKIDNPRIYVETPVVSNLPEDEKATFQIRLTNESEIPDATKYLKFSNFTLYVLDSSNPNGAKLSMDGSPLTSRGFVISPGQSIVKTIEVEKGVGYDFNNIKLVFSDATYTLNDEAYISVNYLPMATTVNMTSPTDKWVLNTLSPSDEDGYYLPIDISGFNVNSDGFHHIELQYKKHTESDTQWTTIDKFYNSDSIYNAATGIKHMLVNGKIPSTTFHGETDPIEMQYDLRAVSFRELGTGFTTRSSEVMTGMKDTRCPEVFGTPEPASGIITYEDKIQLNFTEPIAYNYLDQTSDFMVRGYTNTSSITTSSSLHFPGTETQSAETTVNRNLNKSSFTVDMLVEPVKTDKNMVFFSQGNENTNMSFGLTSDDRLFSRVAGKMSTSEQLSRYSIDIHDALTHVGMIYDNETGTSSFFAGSAIIPTATSQAVTSGYTGNGKIMLGNSFDGNDGSVPFNGNMLEVRLWGKALSETLISKYNGKRLSGYENQLLARWPMDEISGNILKDTAHGAHIKFGGGIEWKTVDGYSLYTDNAPVLLNPELLTRSSDEDYSLTFWFKVDSLMTDTASLFTAGSSTLAAKGKGRLFVGFQGDHLNVVSNDSTYQIAELSDLRDKNWHYLAITANRGQDKFQTYIDGSLMTTFETTKLDGIASDYVALGDKGLQAHFDVFSFWEQALPKYIINNSYNCKVTGKEMGLRAFMPFSTREESDQGVMYDAACIYNCTYSMDDEGNWQQSKQKMVIGNYEESKNLDENSHAPVHDMPSIENLDFSWSSTGTALQINIDRDDKDINKQNVMVVVRNVEDNYGNVMKSPQMMTYYVNKNVLTWDEQTINLECNESEEATAKIGWQNISGKRISFTVDGLPSWLTASETQGTVKPLEEKTLTLTADAGVAAGSYTAVIYLTDENDLSEPLTVNLIVKPAECGWAVDKTKYDRTMNMRAIVKTKNCNDNYVLDADPDDKVGAFIGNACVGVANISDDGNLYMTIYGDTAFAKGSHNIVFRLWQHETGLISELEYMPTASTYGSIIFKTNSVVGLPPEEAITLVTSDKKVQSMSLTKGWNWISFYLRPHASDGINSVFINSNDLFTDGDIIKHVDFAQYSEKTQNWMGNLNETDFHNVYQVYVAKEGVYRIMGYELSDDELTVPVSTGWNDVPYLLSLSTSIDDALADFLVGDKAQTGDIIKSMDQFAVADATNGKMEWVGTLKYMQPGKGYYIYHNGDSTSFKYQTNAIAQSSSTKKTANLKPQTPSLEPNNMPVIATLADGCETQEGDTIVAMANGEIVEAQPVGSRMFMSVNAVDGNVITFGLLRDGQIIATTENSSLSREGRGGAPITYVSTGIVGTIQSPYVIDFNDTTNLESGSSNCYDLSGRKVSGSHPAGVYINNGKKTVTK